MSRCDSVLCLGKQSGCRLGDDGTGVMGLTTWTLGTWFVFVSTVGCTDSSLFVGCVDGSPLVGTVDGSPPVGTVDGSPPVGTVDGSPDG